MARERSYGLHVKVMLAAMKLFAERGIEPTSMDAIAKEATVSKATIYNHWPDKASLLAEVMRMMAGFERPPQEVGSGDFVRDMTAVLSRRPPPGIEELRERMTPIFIAHAALHPDFGEDWKRHAMEPRRQEVLRVLRSGMEAGELRSDLNVNQAAALLLGPIVYAHMFPADVNATAESLGREVAETFFKAHRRCEVNM